MGDVQRKQELMHPFDPRILHRQDYALMEAIVGAEKMRWPDLVIAPDGIAYLYRWHIIPRNEHCNVYFHVQVRSDPERPLHDHPWDNTSHILAGGYDEVVLFGVAEAYGQIVEERRRGDVIHRSARMLHRLVLPDGIDYTMTLFTTGPKIRQWGFQTVSGWISAKDYIETRDGVSYNVMERD